MRPLVLVGAGGFARETAEAVAAVNRQAPTWELCGFVDDDPALAGTTVDGIPVLGPVDLVHRMPDVAVVVCTGHPGNYFSRKRLVDRLALPDDRYATLVHPSAALAGSTTIGPGTVVLAQVVATVAVAIGSHVGVMPGAVFTHDVSVGDFATVGARAVLSGRVCVGEGAYLGAGALIRESRRVGPWALVGMGAVVTVDVPAREVWAGVPARFMRAVEER